MVQRPPPASSSQAAPAAGHTGGGHATPGQTQQPAQAQVHFQLTTTGDGAQAGMPQVDLSQILGQVFGAVGRNPSIGVVHTAPTSGGAAGSAMAPPQPAGIAASNVATSP